MNVIFAIILLVFGIALCVCAMMFGIKYEEYRKAYIRITLPSFERVLPEEKMNKHLSMMIETFVIMLLFIVLCFVILFV